MAYDYESNDGLCKSNNVEFINNWKRIGKEMAENEREWVEQLRSQGVKAAHPDDGWVDRENNTIYFAYPQFNDGVQIGDTIALGWDWHRTRLVRVIGVIEQPLMGEPRYAFEPIVEPAGKKLRWWERLLRFGNDK